MHFDQRSHILAQLVSRSRSVTVDSRLEIEGYRGSNPASAVFVFAIDCSGLIFFGKQQLVHGTDKEGDLT